MKTHKSVLNIIIIMLIALICLSSISYVHASSDPIENPGFYEPTDTTGNNTKFIEIGNIIISVMQVLGTVIAVVAMMVIGIRYMFGSLQDRANFKETMIPYLIGAIMVFAIPTILKIIFDLVNSINLG